MIKKFLIIEFLFILCVGCVAQQEQKEYIPLRTNKELENQFQIQNNEMENLQKDFDTLDTQYKKIKKDYDLLESTLSNYKIWSDDDKFKWVHSEQWDKIIVSKTYEVNKQFEISDERFLEGQLYEAMFYPMQLEEEKGVQSDVGLYTYQFIKEDESYNVQVVGRGKIEIDGCIYSVDSNVHNLGKAFLSLPSYLQHNEILGRIADSGIVIGEQIITYPILDSSRIKGVAAFLYNGVQEEKIDTNYHASRNYSSIVEKLTFYYCGEEIKMNVYEKDIYIIDGEKQYWYHCNEENKILSILKE